MTAICSILQPLEDRPLPMDLWNHSAFTDAHSTVSRLNKITYGYIAPVIITVGVVGDLLTVATLTHPLLRRSNIIYTYLTLLAMTDLVSNGNILDCKGL